MNIIDIKHKNSLKNALEVLRNDGIVIFPTDTVYGIGCALNGKAIKKLYEIKNRPLSQPTAILLTKKLFNNSRSSVNCRTIISENIEKDFSSGKTTIIFPTKYFKIKFPKIIIKDSAVGVRLPKYFWLEKLINILGPIVATSANKRGERAPTKFSEISQKLLKQVDLVIKTDEKLSNKPSAIIDLEHNKIIRN